MNLKTNLNIGALFILGLHYVAGQVFRIDSRFCSISNAYVVCSGVDTRGYDVVEYKYIYAWSVSIVDSPYLTVMPTDLGSTFELRISNTNLENITSEDFRYGTFVRKLDLSSNRIRYLPNDIFVHTDKIMYLNMSWNEIQSLPANLLSVNSNLKEVYLGHNRLSRIDPELFKGKFIETLDVSYNKLSEDLEFLRSMPNLTTLNLSGNCIRHLTARTFEKNYRLEKLFVAHACISYVDYGSFPYNTLVELDLSFNRLDDIDYGVFINATGLKKLLLGGNYVDLSNVRLLISILNLQEIELDSDFYLCRDLVEITREMQKRQTKLLVPQPHYGTSHVLGLKCKNTSGI